MKKKHIDPKPTKFDGVTYRSRLEARFAVMLTACPAVTKFIYEGAVFTDNDTGHTYTPDFIVEIHDTLLYIEVKPSNVTRAAAQEIIDWGAAVDNMLCVAAVDFYKKQHTVYYPKSRAARIKPLTSRIFGTCKHPFQHFDFAAKWRFDLA